MTGTDRTFFAALRAALRAQPLADDPQLDHGPRGQQLFHPLRRYGVKEAGKLWNEISNGP